MPPPRTWAFCMRSHKKREHHLIISCPSFSPGISKIPIYQRPLPITLRARGGRVHGSMDPLVLSGKKPPRNGCLQETRSGPYDYTCPYAGWLNPIDFACEDCTVCDCVCSTNTSKASGIGIFASLCETNPWSPRPTFQLPNPKTSVREWEIKTPFLTKKRVLRCSNFLPKTLCQLTVPKLTKNHFFPNIMKKVAVYSLFLFLLYVPVFF